MLDQVGPFDIRDYRQLPDDERWELIEGELYLTGSPTLMHQRVSMRLATRLMSQVDDPGAGWVFAAPTDVILSEISVLVPDLVLIRRDRRELLTRRAIEGAPDVAVEILSPSTKGRDLRLKRSVYAKYGVSEYWLVHPDDAWVELLELREGRYVRRAKLAPPGTLTSGVFPEVAIPLGPLFEPL